MNKGSEVNESGLKGLRNNGDRGQGIWGQGLRNKE